MDGSYDLLALSFVIKTRHLCLSALCSNVFLLLKEGLMLDKEEILTFRTDVVLDLSRVLLCNPAVAAGAASSLTIGISYDDQSSSGFGLIAAGFFLAGGTSAFYK